MSCKEPIAFEMLGEYWLDEIPKQRATPLEEHLFACAHCARRLGQFTALTEGVRESVKGGRISMVVSGTFVDAMKMAGHCVALPVCN